MKLNPLDLFGLVPHRHHQTVGRLGGDLETIGNRFPFDDQRVIPAGVKTLRNAVKDRSPVMFYLNRFAMDRFGCSNNVSAKMLTDRLVSKTHAEDRNLACKSID